MQNNKKATVKVAFLYGFLAATAEKEDNKCDNDYPGAVVIEKIAKTVVVHKVSPFGEFSPPR